MDEPVEDGVGEGGFAEVIVPGLDRELAGDEGGLAAMAVVEDLEQIAPGVVVEGHQSEVVDQDQIGSREVAQEFQITAVGSGDGQILKQPGQSQVAGGVAVAAGLVGERAGDPGLADAGRASDILMRITSNRGRFTTGSIPAPAIGSRLWALGVCEDRST